MRNLALLFVVLSLSIPAQAAKKVPVRIVDRQALETEYTYAVPGTSSSNCNATVYGGTASGSCTGIDSPGMSGSYKVSGATLSLLLPDGRIVTVNCNTKPNIGSISAVNAIRDCREPISDDLTAEFKGNNAKLEWSVSIDGKKKQHETYKIIGMSK